MYCIIYKDGVPYKFIKEAPRKLDGIYVDSVPIDLEYLVQQGTMEKIIENDLTIYIKKEVL